MADLLKDLGYLALGSRLKRLAERLQADANLVHESYGFSTQSGHFPLLAALHRYGPMTVSRAVSVLKASQPSVTRTASALVKMGMVDIATPPEDRRQRRLSLTAFGKDYVTQMENQMWPGVERAARDMCGGQYATLIEEIERLEKAFDERSLLDRARNPLRIVEYRPELAREFYNINAEWIRNMFSLEAHDEAVLSDPQTHVIGKGGQILFVESIDTGHIVATCALMPDGDGAIELTKMGVRRTMRGKKVGEFLLRAIIKRAHQLGADPLYLLTNTKCAPAIHLYEKLGFHHDEGIMQTYGHRYQRADVAMRYRKP